MAVQRYNGMGRKHGSARAYADNHGVLGTARRLATWLYRNFQRCEETGYWIMTPDGKVIWQHE